MRVLELRCRGLGCKLLGQFVDACSSRLGGKP